MNPQASPRAGSSRPQCAIPAITRRIRRATEGARSLVTNHTISLRARGVRSGGLADPRRLAVALALGMQLSSITGCIRLVRDPREASMQSYISEGKQHFNAERYNEAEKSFAEAESLLMLLWPKYDEKARMRNLTIIRIDRAAS